MKNKLLSYNYYMTITVKKEAKNTVMPLIKARLKTLAKNLQGVKVNITQIKTSSILQPLVIEVTPKKH